VTEMRREIFCWHFALYCYIWKFDTKCQIL